VKKIEIILCLALVLSFIPTGCVTPSVESLGVRAELLASARRGDPDFPDGRSLVLTHFSHIGQLVTSRDEIIYVVDRHSVTAAALSPHGQKFIMFFDEKFGFLGKIGYGDSAPLWCDGSKLYVRGALDRRFWNSAIDRRLEKIPGGNVIDVAAGFEGLTNYHAFAYGSSGGIEDR